MRRRRHLVLDAVEAILVANIQCPDKAGGRLSSDRPCVSKAALGNRDVIKLHVFK